MQLQSSWADGDLVYKFKRIVGKPNFSDQFKKIVKRYIRVGYIIVLCFVVRYFMSILVLQSS